MKNKKIIFHVTRQYMRQNKKRTITTAVGIMFMVIMMTCVFIGKDTAVNYLTQIAESKEGSWHMTVYGVDREQYGKLKELDFIDETAFTYDMGFMECPESENESKPYLELKGYSKDCFGWMNIRLSDGRYPENENEVIVSNKVLTDGAQLAIGDTIHARTFYRKIRGINPDISTTFPYQQLTVSYGEVVEVPQDFPYFGENDSFEEMKVYTGKEKDFVIVGFMDAPHYETEAGAFYGALTWVPDNEDVYKTVKDDQVNLTCRFDLKKFDYTEIKTVEHIMGLDWVDGAYQSDETETAETGDTEVEEETEYLVYDYHLIDTNDLVLSFSGDSSESDINVIANVMVVFFLVFILMVSVILIYNVFNISFEERRKYLGMLASVGATRKQKSSSVYYEAFILLAIALPVGFVIGLAVVKAGMLVLQPYMLRLMDSTVAEVVNNDTVHLVVTPFNLVPVIGASVLTVLISAVLPARKIGRIGPIESIRGIDTGKDRQWSSSPHLMKKGRTESLLAVRNLTRQKTKTGSIIRAVAVFLIVLMVTSFGTSAVLQMVHYRLVYDVTVGYNPEGYDYVLYESRGYGSSYGMLKKEIVNDPDVVETKEWYDGMFAGSFDGRILNENYWNAYRALIRECYGSGLSDEECMEQVIYNDEGGIYETLNIAGVDDETFADIVRKCGCDPELVSKSEYPAILYQNVQLTTDNTRFEDHKPDHYRVFELDSICDLKPGSTFPAGFYSVKEDKLQDFSFTLAGYANKEDVSDYLTFNGEEIWIIVNADTANAVNKVLSAYDDLDTDGNYNVMERCLYIKLSSPDCALAQKLKSLSEYETEEYRLSGGDSEGYNIESIAEALNYAIRILAVCFVVLSGFICLLNLYNSVRGRAVIRKRDIAMLRSIGMEERQLDRMLALENAGMWLAGLAWSLVFSIPITYGIDKFLQRYFGVMQIRFPWHLYLLAAFITIISLLLITKMCYHMREDEILLEEMRV